MASDWSKCIRCGGRMAMTRIEAFYLTKDGGVSKVKVSMFSDLPHSVQEVLFCVKCKSVWRLGMGIAGVDRRINDVAPGEKKTEQRGD